MNSMFDKVSIHAPVRGRDIEAVSIWSCSFVFQSTRPCEGATALTVFFWC